MDFHIGNRLNSIIIADIVGVPNLGIIQEGTLKIKNYIEKTQILTQERIVQFMEPIAKERIET